MKHWRSLNPMKSTDLLYIGFGSLSRKFLLDYLLYFFFHAETTPKMDKLLAYFGKYEAFELKTYV